MSNLMNEKLLREILIPEYWTKFRYQLDSYGIRGAFVTENGCVFCSRQGFRRWLERQQNLNGAKNICKPFRSNSCG